MLTYNGAEWEGGMEGVSYVVVKPKDHRILIIITE